VYVRRVTDIAIHGIHGLIPSSITESLFAANTTTVATSTIATATTAGATSGTSAATALAGATVASTTATGGGVELLRPAVLRLLSSLVRHQHQSSSSSATVGAYERLVADECVAALVRAFDDAKNNSNYSSSISDQVLYY
jgi:hypothetical protein